MKGNKKGFTLVELLAALVILGLLMVVAAPNVLGILNKNKSEIYVEDAKKLVARAEYVMRGDTSITKPNGSNCVFFSLGYLDNAEFSDPPQGGEYFINKSFVKACKESGEYVYYVQLLECDKKEINDGSTKTCGNNGYKGIPLTKSTNLFGENATDLVKAPSGITFNSIPTSGTLKTYCDLDVGCGTAAAVVDDD